jgi:hypothetical protein
MTTKKMQLFFLFISSLLYMFRANLSPISFRYCPPILLLAGIVEEMESSMIPASSNIVGQYPKL